MPLAKGLMLWLALWQKIIFPHIVPILLTTALECMSLNKFQRAQVWVCFLSDQLNIPCEIMLIFQWTWPPILKFVIEPIYSSNENQCQSVKLNFILTEPVSLREDYCPTLRSSYTIQRDLFRLMSKLICRVFITKFNC